MEWKQEIVNHIDIQGSLADILHHSSKFSVLGEGMLVFIEEGEDDHDACPTINN